jgi:hypothetical protein
MLAIAAKDVDGDDFAAVKFLLTRAAKAPEVGDRDEHEGKAEGREEAA